MTWITRWPSTSPCRWPRNTKGSGARQTEHCSHAAEHLALFVSPHCFGQPHPALDGGTDVIYRYTCILHPSTATHMAWHEHLSRKASVRQGSPPPFSLSSFLCMPLFLAWKLLGTNSRRCSVHPEHHSLCPEKNSAYSGCLALKHLGERSHSVAHMLYPASA